MQIRTTIIKFPDLQLRTRDGHKLHGFFGNLFKEHSPLLHNHYENGKFRYKYPLVQYKVIDKIPMLIGINEGAMLLTELFLKIRLIVIDDQEYKILSKNITNNIINLNELSKLRTYKFKTLWMALNQTNYMKYKQLTDKADKKSFLEQQIINNILSFYKGIDYRIAERIMVSGNFRPHSTKFKDKKILVFEGDFVTNAVIPDYVGIGKAVSRGFGTVVLNMK